MKKLAFLLLFLVLSAYGQPQLISATPAPWAGTSGTFTVTFSNYSGPGTWYFVSFSADGVGLLPGIVAPNSCTIVFNAATPGQNFGAVITSAGGLWYGFGPSAPFEPGFYGPQNSSNNQCTLHDYTGGSGWRTLPDNSLQLTLVIDFNAATFSGPKMMFWGTRYCCSDAGGDYNNTSAGPLWYGAVTQNGQRSIWMVGGNFGGALTGSPVTLPTTTDDYSPTASFTNATPGRTDQNAYFQVGDYYQFNVTGPPYAPVVVTRTVDGFDAGTLNFTLDGNGNLAPGGAFDASAIGFWTEQWIVNGYPTPILSWAVIPASGAPVLSFLNITPGPRYGTTNYVVGETYHFDLAGQPGAVIWKGCVFNGAPCSGPLAPNLAMPSNGHWTFDGVIQPGDAGIQVESWMVGGVPAGPPITLTVLPQ